MLDARLMPRSGYIRCGFNVERIYIPNCKFARLARQVLQGTSRVAERVQEKH